MSDAELFGVRKRRARSPGATSVPSDAPSLRGKTYILWLWASILFFMTAPLEIFISGNDPDVALAGSSHTYFYMRILVALFCIRTCIKMKYNTVILLKKSWPYIAFFAVFGVLLVFAVNPKESSTAFINIATTLIAGFTCAMRMTPSQLSKVTLYAMAMAVVSSLLVALFWRKIGVHSGSDISGGSGRAGEWRGVYIHKNYLGHVSGLTFAMTIIFGRKIFGSVYITVGIAAIAFVCAVMSHSSSALAIIVALPALYFAFILPKGWKRSMAIFSAVVLVIALAPYRDDIISAIMVALNRNATLSGRTSIWHLAQDIIVEHPFFGGGIGFTITSDFRPRLLSTFRVDNVHNAYLDCILNYGFIGAAALAAAIAAAIFAAWSRPLNRELEMDRAFFTTLLVGWSISGMSEIMAMRPYGVVVQLGTTAIFGLFAVAAAPRRNQQTAAIVKQKITKTARKV
jgi:exopolysaccharide production protein ExoQ